MTAAEQAAAARDGGQTGEVLSVLADSAAEQAQAVASGDADVIEASVETACAIEEWARSILGDSLIDMALGQQRIAAEISAAISGQPRLPVGCKESRQALAVGWPAVRDWEHAQSRRRTPLTGTELVQARQAGLGMLPRPGGSAMARKLAGRITSATTPTGTTSGTSSSPDDSDSFLARLVRALLSLLGLG